MRTQVVDETKFFLFGKARNTSCLARARAHVKDLENNFLASRACRKGRVKSQRAPVSSGVKRSRCSFAMKIAIGQSSDTALSAYCL